MPNYRRADVPGGTFFFTVVTYRRRLLFEHPEARRILRETVLSVQCKHPFTIDAWVLLPDHLHCIWTLPPEDADFSLRWNRIKSTFSKQAKPLFHNEHRLSDSQRKHWETTIWQRRFWEHHIRNDEEYQIYMDYIHFNPVKHGWAKQVADWPFSTFHRYVQAGVYPIDWGGQSEEVFPAGIGE